MSQPTGAVALPVGILDSAEPVEILYEAEEPIVFTLRTTMGEKLLAYLADANTTARWLLMAPCSDELLAELKGGRRTLREALGASWTWLGKLDNDDQWQGTWTVSLDDLPREHLPVAGVMLLPEQQAAIDASRG